MSAPLLRARGITKRYGGVVALNDVSLSLEAGSITGLIGPNGSGKSTLFDCLCGFQTRDAGSVEFDGRDLRRMAPQRVARLGLRRTFQQLRVFPELSLRDNLRVAAQSAPGFPMLAELLRTPAVRAHERRLSERAATLLDEVRLAPLADQLAGGLSYGQKKLLELAMALMTEPRLLLLDEPMAGVNPTLVEALAEELRRVNRQGVALLIVEHNLKLVFDLAQHIVVLDQGRVLTEGPPDAVARDERVIEAYLGAGPVAANGTEARLD